MEKITVILDTFNSSEILYDTLESIRDLEEIIVVDKHSKDETVEIAKEYRSKVIYADKNDLTKGLNQALEEASGSWILIIQDNEIIPNNLIKELRYYAQHPKKNKYAVNVSKKIIYLNKEVKSARIKKTLRFFKKGSCEFKNTTNPTLEVKSGKIHSYNQNFKIPKGYILEFSSNDITKNFENIIEEKRDLLKKTKTQGSFNPLKPVFSFLFYFIIKGGILDGKRGLIFAYQKMFESFLFETGKFEKREK